MVRWETRHMYWGARLLAVTQAFDHVLELICKLFLLVTGLALLGLLTLVVVLRYAFQSGLTFAPDLSELLFAIFVMAGIALAARRGVHVATQLLLYALKGRWRTALALLIHVITAITYALLSSYAFENAVIAHDQTTPVLQIPWSVGYGCLSIGLALVAASSLTRIVRLTLGQEEIKVDLADPGVSTT
jgi:TRAP-type C4-dicarboxylate transport system permease small subunit